MTMVAEETQKDDGYMRLADVATMLKTSPRSVRRMVAECEIPRPIMRRGRIMLWHTKQFERWLKRKMDKP